MILTREDSFRGVRVHTFAWMLFDAPCWLASEVGPALGTSLGYIDAGLIDGVDFARVDGEDAFELYEAVRTTNPAERPLPALVLFPTGITMVCVDSAHGAELRRLLLREAAEDVRERLGRARLEREIDLVYRDEEIRDRARKALALHRTVEAARRTGALVDDDAAYADCMASIAEIATGVRFPTRSAVENAAEHARDRARRLKGDLPEI